eukprot:Anaeramoba_ignava/a217728_118.p2 GENE.a217728_118~~a217728_118.p2  ORF type:complete len:525 (-),score=175.77 a217728_118:2237-3811(-)
MTKQIENYLILGRIGEGMFAKVKLGIHIPSNTQVAIKIIDKASYSFSQQAIIRLQNELRAISLVDHPNIAKFYEMINTKKHIYIIMEYLQNGELFDFINENGPVSEERGCAFLKQILGAVKHCHDFGIIHRDIKPENLLLDLRFNLKLIDFGLSTFLQKKNSLCKTSCGSPSYSAPEVIHGHKYQGKKADIWSIGIVLYALLCGSLPFGGSTTREICDCILRGKFSVPAYLSDSAQDLLQHMIDPNPKTRYSLEKILRHDWLSKNSTEINTQNSFTSFRYIATHDLDSSLTAQMQTLGFSVENLHKSFASHTHTKETATYRLLLEKKEREKILPDFPLPKNFFPISESFNSELFHNQEEPTKNTKNNKLSSLIKDEKIDSSGSVDDLEKLDLSEFDEEKKSNSNENQLAITNRPRSVTFEEKTKMEEVEQRKPRASTVIQPPLPPNSETNPQIQNSPPDYILTTSTKKSKDKIFHILKSFFKKRKSKIHQMNDFTFMVNFSQIQFKIKIKIKNESTKTNKKFTT